MNNRFSILFFSRIVCAALVVLLASCGGSNAKKENNDDEFKNAADEINNQVKKVLAKLPPPSEIPYKLQATGAEFDESLVNAIENADNYLSTDDKAALNLGIYAADIGYLTSYEKTQEALDYMQAAKALSGKLNLETTLSEELIKKFEENLSSKDELAKIVNDVITDSDKVLQDNQRNKTAALLLTGSFIESMYLATALIENYPTDLPSDARNTILVPIVRIVLDQEQPLADLIALLKSVDQDAQVTGLVNSMEALKAKFEALDIEEQIKNNKGDELLKNTTLDEITNSVDSIRDQITE